MTIAIHHDLPQRLARRLEHPLPGYRAQRRFSPRLGYGRHFGPPAYEAREAAVVALLYWQEGQWHVPVTLRRDHLPDHGGQVSFPGGVVEEGESSRQGALRELEEELGVAASEVKLLGALSKINLYASNFLVTPWLAVAAGRPCFRPNPAEVAQLVEVPLAALLDRRHYGRHVVQRRCLSFEAPHIEIDSHRIWGATSMMLGELISLLNEMATD